VRQALGSYLCRSWNSQRRERDSQLATLDIYFVKLQTNTEDMPKVESRKKVWHHWCYPEFASP